MLCLCFNRNGNDRYIVWGHFYEKIENNHNIYRSINSLEIIPKQTKEERFSQINGINNKERKKAL